MTPMLSGSWVDPGSFAVRQSLALLGEDRRAAVVEIKDLGDHSVHFLEKAEMGRRLGLAALTVAYGQSHIYTGPRMVETKIMGNKAIVRFDQVGDGIVYQPSIDGISGVYLRGKTGPSRWGHVQVLGKDTVEFSHPDIANLEMIAYGSNTNPHETVFNSAGLPASPFIVNPIKSTDPKSPFELLSVHSKIEKGPLLVGPSHVRRSGCVFQLVRQEKDDPALLANPRDDDEQVRKSPASINMQAYIPAEWKGYEVESAGKTLDATETTEDGGTVCHLQRALGQGLDHCRRSRQGCPSSERSTGSSETLSQKATRSQKTETQQLTGTPRGEKAMHSQTATRLRSVINAVFWMKSAGRRNPHPFGLLVSKPRSLRPSGAVLQRE